MDKEVRTPQPRLRSRKLRNGTVTHTQKYRRPGVPSRQLTPASAELIGERGGVEPVELGPPPVRRSAIATMVALLALLAFWVAPGFGAKGKAVPDAAPLAPGERIDGFVSSSGGSLLVSGQVWNPIGFNDYRLTAAPGAYVCDGGVGELDGPELAAHLDRIRAAGGNVVRTWFFQSSLDSGGGGRFAAFDRVVDAAEDRGIRVIPVLTNHWAACEGDGARDKDLDYYAGGFRSPQMGQKLSFLDYARTVAEHYADSDAIAFWQLANEPEAGSSAGCDEYAAAEALATFAAEGAAAIRKVDPNHLISLGTMGSGQCGAAGSNYMRAHAEIDICEIHVYDSPESGTSPLQSLPGDASNGVAARIAACGAAGKPIVAGEIGFYADLDASGNRTGRYDDQSLANRAGFLRERVSAMAAQGLDGFLIWGIDPDAPDAGSADPYGSGPCDPSDQVVASFTGGSSFVADDGCGGAGGETLAQASNQPTGS